MLRFLVIFLISANSVSAQTVSHGVSTAIQPILELGVGVGAQAGTDFRVPYAITSNADGAVLELVFEYPLPDGIVMEAVADATLGRGAARATIGRNGSIVLVDDMRRGLEPDGHITIRERNGQAVDVMARLELHDPATGLIRAERIPVRIERTGDR